MAIVDLRRNGMMAHLLDALASGKDIGHYGRLVFAMVARHFLYAEEVVGYLMKNPDVTEQDARALYLQVQGKDYSPPRRPVLSPLSQRPAMSKTGIARLRI